MALTNIGVHAGLEIGKVFSDLEMQYIANRKALFLKAAKEPDFRTAVFSGLKAYSEANSLAAVNALSRARRLAEEELRISRDTGVKAVDRAVRDYELQGAEIERRGMETDRVLIAGLTGLLGGLAQAAAYSQNSARNQVLQITATIDTSAPDIYAEIDRAQGWALKKGVAGAAVGGSERELDAHAEYLVRDGSHRTMLAAEGERAGEYGLFFVLVSAHPSSCPLCLPWQNQVLIDNVFNHGVPDGKHELLSTALDSGLGHPYCRHNWVAFIPGLDNPNLFAHDTASPRETAERYAIEQAQRYNERMIVAYKRRAAGAVSEREQTVAEKKVAEWQERQRALAQIAKDKGLPFYRQYSREQIKAAEPSVRFPKSNLTEGVERVTMNYKESLSLPAESFKTAVREGRVNLKLEQSKQNKHIKGTNENKLSPEKSYLIIGNDEIRSLAREYAGTGRMVSGTNAGQQKEVVTLPFEVGYILDNGEWISTNRLTIHYSKTGIHVVPKWREK